MEPRAPSIRPVDVLAGREDILFLHPGYLDQANLLLKLPRFDQAEPTQFGVHHATALLACQIIAANQFTGYLVDEHKQPVAQDVVILLGRKYFFVVDNDEQYPVVPSFRDWEFPHDDQPNWPQIPFTPSTPDVCCITASLHAVQRAHIIPQEVKDWYNANGMAKHAITPVFGINEPSNHLPMRSDIHYIFDNRCFIIVPKLDNYRVHCISRLAGPVDIHDIPAQGIAQDIRPHLLARFAWAILLQVKPFILSGHSRKVKVHTSDGRWETSEMPGAELYSCYGGGGSQGSSPRKRRRPGQDSSMDDLDTVSGERRAQNWSDETVVEKELQSAVSDLVHKIHHAAEIQDGSMEDSASQNRTVSE